MNRESHPRPQFIRENWQSLDGEWDFCFDDENKGIKKLWFKGFTTDNKIVVPFSYETKLSNINVQDHHPIVWYQKKLNLEKDKHITINFEGADYITTVWLNGNQLGVNRGGYHRFTFDLDEYLIDGENTIVVRCEDSLDTNQTRGKQRWLNHNFGCWYVQTTGIWKSIWLEYRKSPIYLRSAKITPEIDKDQVIINPVVSGHYSNLKEKNLFLETELLFDGKLVCYSKEALNHTEQSIILDTRVKEDSNWGTKIWSTEDPNLYDIRYRLLDEHGEVLDTVESYLGMRKISIDKNRILLNNRELYQRLILDQGYWPDSGLTPPSLEALKLDLTAIKKLGYNGLRKHQKIEDERFLYLCDKLGILVWTEMPSAYQFSDISLTRFTEEWLKIVTQHYNHPSVITWVPFNESWGIKDIFGDKKQQRFTEGIYYLTKSLDPHRPVITNDGWEHTISDIITLHDYEEFAGRLSERYADKMKLVNNDIQFNKDKFAFASEYDYLGQPIIISEFGGIAFDTDDEEQWGYGSRVKNQEDYINRFKKIHEAIQGLEYVSGYCYTQLTDVEQEINGLLDKSRNPKISFELINEINNFR